MTIEGVTHLLGPPFLVIATQNPIEYEGTYPLPEAQLDRFLLRTAFGYPSRDDEVEVLGRRIEREDGRRRARAARRSRDAARDAAGGRDACTSRRASARYCVDLVGGDPDVGERRSRREPAREPRPAQARPLRGPRCRVATTSFPDDVKAVAVPALAHRLVLRPELWVQRVSGEDVVREVLDSVPTPKAEDVAGAAVTRAAQPSPRGLRGSRRRRARRRARSAPPRARGSSPHRSRSFSPSALAAARAPELDVSFALDDERIARGRAVAAQSTVVRTDDAVDRLELLLVPSARRRGRRRRRRLRASGSQAGEERELASTLRCRAGACTTSVTLERTRPRPPPRSSAGRATSTRHSG